MIYEDLAKAIRGGIRYEWVRWNYTSGLPIRSYSRRFVFFVMSVNVSDINWF